MHHSEIKSEVRRLIADGTVLPAHPLALDADRKLDRVHQRALTQPCHELSAIWRTQRLIQRIVPAQDAVPFRHRYQVQIVIAEHANRAIP